MEGSNRRTSLNYPKSIFCYIKNNAKINTTDVEKINENEDTNTPSNLIYEYNVPAEKSLWVVNYSNILNIK